MIIKKGQKAYRVYDDFRFLGEYATKKEVLATGLIKASRNTFLKRMREDGFYAKKNITVTIKGDIASNCSRKGYLIMRHSRLSPDIHNISKILSVAIRSLSKADLF